ncbi:MAG: hypothetical protein ACJAVA_000233 [Flavobacteriaceae bacterium]|jgi:hypothetical protein
MVVNFITPTRLSLIDITSMGDSSKRGDASTIGQFDSGLKYAIALLLRNKVKIDIEVHGGEKEKGSYEEPYTDLFSFDTYTETCESTGKEKELIKINVNTTYHGGTPMSSHDMREPSNDENYTVKTGFAKALGHNWELWMALRELWSNMLDEEGHIAWEKEDVDYGTVVSLVFDTDNPFYDVWQNRHLYINEKEPLHIISNRVDALENKEGYLRVYKQDILVYENKDTPSRFAYNIKFGEIDERRILSNLYSVEGSIVEAIMSTKNHHYLKEIITSDFETSEKEFLSGRTTYSSASDIINMLATECYNKHGEVKSYEWLIKSVKKRRDCQIKGRIVTTVEDSLWSYSRDVTIETIPEVKKEEDTIEVEIESNFNFKFNVEVKRAKLKGSKVIADKFNKTLILDYDFDITKNMSEFFVQYIELTMEGNVVKNLGDYITDILKR